VKTDSEVDEKESGWNNKVKKEKK